jgi:predicted ABC-type transport system involved in lysophospholipase L1 biosynthesis ATPase subunit
MLPAMATNHLPKNVMRQRAIDLLTSVGLEHRLTHRPQELSGGEQQRAAIARALINEPHLILADEPTGNLDAITGEGVLDLLFNLVKERQAALVMVTHSPEIAGRCHTVYRLDGGKLILQES